MPSSAVLSFSEPDDYAASILAARTEITVTEGGQFTAGLVDIDLDRLRLQRGAETLARVTHAVHPRGQAVISFMTKAGPPMLWEGVEMQPDCIMWHSEGQAAFQRSGGPVCWGTMSLPTEMMASAGAALAGRALTPPRQMRTIHPSASALTRLQNLHAAAARLAGEAPGTLANPEAARGMRHALVQAMVGCLGGAAANTDRPAPHHQIAIMRRFRAALEARAEEAIYIPELCAEIRVSDRTLRACCQNQLGVGPHRYLMLRRMHLARRALRRSTPMDATVTEIATRYGFWQFGRFAGEYKSLFGELPSVTLARLP
jgi:AraC-like DNA-binding protein